MGIYADAKVNGFATCRTCGQTRLPQDGPRCRSCDTLLPTAVYVQRLNRWGEWEQVSDLDFTSHLPRPRRRRRKYSLRRAALLVLLGCLPGGMIWGWSWKLQRNVAQQQVETDAYQAQGVGVIPVRLELTFQRVAGGKLLFRGQTNLPDGTVLQARIARNTTVLAQDYPIVVRDGLFESAPLASRGRSFRPGDYEIELLARFGATAQSESVFQVVGPGGKKLTGPLVEPSQEEETVKTVAFRGGIRLR